MKIWLAYMAISVLTLAGCQFKNNSDLDNEGVKPKAVDSQSQQLTSLPLPPFPDYPVPQNSFSADDKGTIYFPIKSPYDFSRVLNGYLTLKTHAGKGVLSFPEDITAGEPGPAMVILHGSGGIREGREDAYARLFNENGIAAFVVDYYEPRGVTDQTPYVMKTMAATEVDVISDAYSALKILGTHPLIDASRIGVTGYSYGGMGTRYVLDKRLKDIMAADSPPFALHMDIYGPCHQNTGAWETTGAPYLAIYGDSDNSVEPKKCAIVQDKLKAGGSRVEAHLIKDAGHAWEMGELREFEGGFVRGCEFTWDTETGAFMVDGKTGFQPEPHMDRPQRAAVRAGLGALAGKCVGQGYTVGRNEDADIKSKAIQLEFMKRVFGL